MIIGNRAVCKTVELRKLCNIIPDLLIIGMENMCTILMNIDSLNLLCVHVSCNIRAFVDHENRFARLLRLMSKDSTVKTGAYDKIIVHSFFSLLFDVIILPPVLRVWQVFFFVGYFFITTVAGYYNSICIYSPCFHPSVNTSINILISFK